MDIQEKVKRGAKKLAQISFEHPLGFSKLVLSGTTHTDNQIRLHIWNGLDSGDIHNHPWHFESYVLRGALENTFYRISSHGDFRRYNCFSSGTSNGFQLSAKGTASAIAIQRKVLCEGKFYYGNAHQFHSSRPLEVGTVTLFSRTKFLRHHTTVMKKAPEVKKVKRPSPISEERYLDILERLTKEAGLDLSCLPALKYF